MTLFCRFLSGESALHLAIVNGDLDSVKLLVAKGANVNQRATGRFFLPDDQKVKRKKHSNYIGMVIRVGWSHDCGGHMTAVVT